MGLNNFLSKLFGNKAQRDIREIEPFVLKVQSVYPSVEKLSNDELRARTQEIRDRIQQYVSEEKKRIDELKAQIEGLEIEEREKTYEEIDKLDKVILEKYEEALEEVLPEAFAIVKDTARRFTTNETVEVTATEMDGDLAATHDFVEIDGNKAIYKNHWIAGGNDTVWNMIHYDVQLFGGVVLHKGKIAEMATGEGKTLVATLPVFLNALTGNGVHVITVNDYLAKRDSEWMGPLYQFHGLTVDCIDKHQPNSEGRRKAYLANITFGTNNEFGFDYLRDNMATQPEDLVQRGHNYAIVDEVDSVLIDDARTPLIISGPVPKGEDQQFEEYLPFVESLVKEQRDLCTRLLAKAKQDMSSGDNEEGVKALYRSFKGLPKNKPLIKFLSEKGNKVAMLKTEEAYMEQQNRRMPGLVNDLSEEDERENEKIKKRIAKQEVAGETELLENKYKLYGNDALYFVVDEKNNSVELAERGLDLLAKKTNDQHFFVLPDVGGEIAEIEKSSLSAEEKQEKKDILMQNYSIKSERVHTVNQLLKAYTLFEKDDEYVIVDNKVKIVDEQTGRIMEGRRYSDGLHQAIEAKERVKVEAATQTFATITLQNYFRMYHKLSGMTGTAETEAGELWSIYKLDVVVIPTNRRIARNDMEDRVYRTKREKYNAVIDEIALLIDGGRPVLVGTTSVEISELISRMLTLRKIKHNVLNAKLHQKEADIVAEAGKGSTVTIATNMAGRGTDIKLSTIVKDAGGLAIIGTERHESRRVDRQLRGRSGRQGDPGSSIFYVSLEDDLMRLFGSERISGVMDRLGFKEGEVIEHSMISKSIERAQKKVEENHFGIRKRLLEYDDVMNAQREVIYKKRRQTLMGERMGVNIMNMIYDSIQSIIEDTKGSLDFEMFQEELMRILAIDSPVSDGEFRNMKEDALAENVFESAMLAFKRKTDKISEVAYPVIKDVYERQGAQYENILIPITDGKRMYNVPVNLKTAYESEGKEIVKVFEKSILLHTIDDNWKEHLREMDELRNSVQNASYEQKDPLLIYKLESYNLFKKMVDEMNRKAISVLMRGQIPVAERRDDIREAAPQRRGDYSKYRTGREGGPAGGAPERRVEPVRVEKKIGRNEPCPCGSGKKYKHCHGQNS